MIKNIRTLQRAIVALASVVFLGFGLVACNNPTGGGGSGATIFTVTFNSAGGSAVDQITGVEHGATITAPEEPTRAFAPGAGLWTNPLPAGNYTFNHWSAPGETGPFEFEATPITANITLTAQWTAPATLIAYNMSDVIVHLSDPSNTGSFTLLVGTSVSYGDAAWTLEENVHLTVEGIGGRRTIIRVGNGAIFNLDGANRSLTLGNDITLAGHSGNNAPLVWVQNGASLTMKDGARITGNTASGNSQAGGVHVNGAGSVFTMKGGVISGNAVTAIISGGGVRVGNGASFRMYGGYIEDNEARATTGAIGGGVFINEAASTFYMLGGTVRNNRAPTSPTGAGGVRISDGALRIVSGVIYGSDGGANANTGAGYAALMLSNAATATARRGMLDGNWASADDLVPGSGVRGDNYTIRVP